MVIIDEIRKLRSSEKEWKSFGLTIGTILGAAGLFLWWRGKDIYQYVFYLGVVLVASGFFVPHLLKNVYRIWMALGIVLGWIVSRAILILVYYIVIVPLGLILRALGKDLLATKSNLIQKSYWQLRESKINEQANYEKQF